MATTPELCGARASLRTDARPALAGRSCEREHLAAQTSSAHKCTLIGQLVAIRALVGVLGGLIGPVNDGLDEGVPVADR